MRELLYILSPSFSGSTLLTFLLAAHPEIATVGELKASAIGDVESYRCSCGALLKQCDFWRKVKTGMKKSGVEFDFDDFGTHFTSGPAWFRRLVRLGARNPLLSQSSSQLLRIVPFCRSRLERTIGQNRILIDLIASIQGGRIFLDASKDPERLTQLLLSKQWKIRVVHLLRDGRGVSSSYKKHHNVDMKSAAAEWLRTERACVHVAARMARKDVLTVKYEDVCREPQRTIEEIFAFAGLVHGISVNGAIPESGHVLGNAMRLSGGKRILLDERWRTELLPCDLRVFDAIGGDLNRRRGYM
ncbi:MAG: sulfotransferase [Chthoniobacterales bacterium]|nr:sulfotransferase [Chthoniobacterales bacterium]